MKVALSSRRPADTTVAFLGQALRELRRDSGLTQAVIAKRAALQIPAVARLERMGPRSLRSLMRYARAAGFHLELHITPVPRQGARR